MSNMFSGLESVGVIFIIFAVGFLFSYKKIWPESTPGVLSNIATLIAAPALAVATIVPGYDKVMLVNSLVLILITLIHALVMLFLGKVSSRILRLKTQKKAVYEINFIFSNLIFIGLPINQLVFGETATPFLFAQYIVTFTFLWSYGAYQIAKVSPDRQVSANTSGKPQKHSISVSAIFNPCLISILVAYAFVYAEIDLPRVIGPALGYLGNLTVPLALLVIGANLTIFRKGIPKPSADEIMIMVAKFLISPLLMLVLLKLFGITGMPFYVFLLSSTMPCNMQTSILAQHYNVEPGYASKLIGLSTMISIVTIPCYVALITGFAA